MNNMFNSLTNNFRNKVYSTCSLTVVSLSEYFSRDVEAKFIQGFVEDISSILDVRRESARQSNVVYIDHNLESKTVRSFLIYIT